MVEDPAKLSEYTERCNTVFGLSCAHDIKCRLNTPGQRLLIEDFHPHWLYDKNYIENKESDILDLVQNPRVVKRKGRPKGALEGANTAKSKADWSTERDSSQYELIEAAILGDTSNLKGIHRVPKKTGHPKAQKAASKTKAQPKSPLKKQKRKQTKTEETYEESIIRITNRRRNKTIIIQSSSDEEEDPIAIKSSDDKILGAAEEAEVETEIEEAQISASERPQRSASAKKLPQKLKGWILRATR